MNTNTTNTNGKNLPSLSDSLIEATIKSGLMLETTRTQYAYD